jgi:hypothetical protein
MKKKRAKRDPFQGTAICLNESAKSLLRMRESLSEGNQIVRESNEQLDSSKKALNNSSVPDLRSISNDKE